MKPQTLASHIFGFVISGHTRWSKWTCPESGPYQTHLWAWILDKKYYHTLNIPPFSLRYRHTYLPCMWSLVDDIFARYLSSSFAHVEYNQNQHTNFLSSFVWTTKNKVPFIHIQILDNLRAGHCVRDVNVWIDVIFPLIGWNEKKILMFVSDWANLIWVCVITFNLFMNAVRMAKTTKYEWWVPLMVEVGEKYSMPRIS